MEVLFLAAGCGLLSLRVAPLQALSVFKLSRLLQADSQRGKKVVRPRVAGCLIMEKKLVLGWRIKKT